MVTDTFKPTVLAIVGPTCTGKTDLSLHLAEEFDGEIIACDSRTIYRYMDIGTAKPDYEVRQRIPHHMIDVAEPDEIYTAADYARGGREAIEKISGRGKLPIVCGGTGFYARALLEGLKIPEVAPQPELRRKLAEFADRDGNEALHKRLAEVDAAAACRINCNDRFRVIRALEVSTITGQPFSQLAGKVDPGFRTIWAGLHVESRDSLHRAIEKRFGEQMAAGMLAETEFLLERYGHCQVLANTVNYKQLVAHLKGEMTLEEAGVASVRHNNKLARRQLIWFRANPEITWFAVDTYSPGQLRLSVVDFVVSQASPLR